MKNKILMGLLSLLGIAVIVYAGIMLFNYLMKVGGKESFAPVGTKSDVKQMAIPSNGQGQSFSDILSVKGDDSILLDKGVSYGDLLPEGDPGNLLDKVNFLDAAHQAGIDTIGSTLKNASHDIRRDIPNPKRNVSPWMMSTIEPDPFRRCLDC